MDKNIFWSVDKLIPGTVGTQFPSKTQKGSSGGVPIRILDEKIETKDFGPEIRPKGSRVIRSYRLTNAKIPQNIFWNEDFGAGTPPFVPCTLYSPAYFSLSTPQKKYLLYFFKCISERKKVQTSFPYLQLFLCKTIREGLLTSELPKEFYWAWAEYRGEFPLADKLFADTFSDFYFLVGKKPPYDFTSEILSQKNFTARPFLLNAYLFDELFFENHIFTPKECDLILRSLTCESFRKAKAYRFHDKFPYVAEEAVSKAIRGGLFSRKDLNDILFSIQIPSEVRVERRLFQNLPIQEIPIAEISLTYVPYLHDENIRSRIDETIRYLENRIRKILKIKNSLSRIFVSEMHKNFLEGILAEYEYLAPIENEEAEEKTPLPAVKRDLKIDFEEASKIEEESRQITMTLTEAYTDSAEESIVLGGEADEVFDQCYESELKNLEARIESTEDDFWEFASTLTETEDFFIRLLIHRGKEEARRHCAANGLFFEAVVASCNEKAMDTCGDAVIDGQGEPYADYLEGLKTVFPPIKGEENGTDKA